MSFIGKWVGSIGKSLGLFDEPAAPPPPIPVAAAPTAANSSDALDLAAQKQAAAMQGGKTSTMLNGAMGVDDKKNTSKILLGQ